MDLNLTLPEYSLRIMAPEIFLFIWALVVIAYDLMTGRKQDSGTGYLALLGLIITGVILAVTEYGTGFGKMYVNDPVALFFKIVFLGAAFMAIGSSFGLIKDRIVAHRGEYFGLMLFSTCGMMFLASAEELLQLWIGLELTTIPLFILAAFYKENRFSVEAGIKYFVVGAFSSAMMLYGLSFLYGLSGTTELAAMKMNLLMMYQSLGTVGLVFIIAVISLLAGIGFKLGLPPFHQWVPDVYEGSPTPVAAFLSVGSKGAGLIAFAKIFLAGLSGFWGITMVPYDWGYLTGIIAAAALIYGNVVAIRQTNIKRMLGYSSIAQAGYIMIGMVAVNMHGLSSVGFYIFAYLFANMGAFAIVAAVEDRIGSTEIAAYRGLSTSAPGLSITLSVFLLSLAGIPPLAGFMAKYKVFAAAISAAGADAANQWLYWLVGVGLITAVFSLYYYANIIKQMYFWPEPSEHKIKLTIPSAVVIGIGLVGVFLFGLYAEPIIDFADQFASVYSLLAR